MTRLTRRDWLILAAGCVAAAALSANISERPPATPQQHSAADATPAPDPALRRKAMDAAGSAIRSSGYDCQYVNDILPYVWSGIEGYTVKCNGFRYTFYIENHGGKWSVKSD